MTPEQPTEKIQVPVELPLFSRDHEISQTA